MSIKIKKTVVQEVEIQIPYYFKYRGSYIKIIDENNLLRIGISEDEYYVTNVLGPPYPQLTQAIEQGDQILESEFNDKLNTIINKINGAN